MQPNEDADDDNQEMEEQEIDLRTLSPEELGQYKEALIHNGLSEQQAETYIIEQIQAMDPEDDDADEEEGEIPENYENEEEGVEGQEQMPPLDPSRKIKRDIVKLINGVREPLSLNKMHRDYFTELLAYQYADQLVAIGKEDPELLKKMTQDGVFKCQVIPLVSKCNLEEGVSNNGAEMHKIFTDTHGLLMELEEGRQLILDQECNHIAVGCAHDDSKLFLVELYSKKLCGLETIAINEQEKIVISAHMFNDAYGPYAFRLCDASNMKKDVLIVGPEAMTYDPTTFKYTITFSFEYALYSDKFGEIYLRKKPQTIPYGTKTEEKLSVEGLELGLKLPMEIIPLPQIIQEDALDEEAEQKEKITMQQKEKELKEKLEQERDTRLQLRIQQAQEVIKEKEKKEKSISNEEELMESQGSKKSGDEEEKSVASIKSRTIGSKEHEKEPSKICEEEKSGEPKDEEDDKEKMEVVAANKEDEQRKREELIERIKLIKEEKEELMKKNAEFQKEIVTLFEKKGTARQSNQTDTTMNEQKYINTLANVNQVRLKLKQMQDTYNMMTAELQDKHKERSDNAKKLLDWFKVFKSEIIREAEFTKTNKKIDKSTVLNWEKSEENLNQRLHEERLNNIMLKNALKKNEHKLKKKEELADGLNLIDFEQLKIENQTLNEKIEERNEELHKLKKKIHNAVISITHIKEKLEQVGEKITSLEGEHKSIINEKDILQKQLANEKQERAKRRIKVQKKRKEVGFVHNKKSTAVEHKGKALLNKNMVVEEPAKIDLEEVHKKMISELPIIKDKIAKLLVLKKQLVDVINSAKNIPNK